MPLRLSNSADSPGTVLTQGQHRINSQGHARLSSAFFSLMWPTQWLAWAPHTAQFSGMAWVSLWLGPFGFNYLSQVIHISHWPWDQTD